MPERMTSEDVESVAELVRLLQSRMHPFYAPFVAVTVHGLRRLAEKNRDV